MCALTRIRRMLALGMLGTVAACGSLLPETHATTQSPWHSFDEARKAVEKVAPMRSHRADLARLGFDPESSANVVLLNYADILRRFAPPAGNRPLSQDPGLQSCLAAASTCQGLEVVASGQHAERVGSFWADFLNFHRESHITGWSFNAIILMKGDLVVYRTWGGEPKIERNEDKQNPLGPIQDVGDSLRPHG